MQDVLKILNFASWFALYQFLVEQGYEHQPRLLLYPPDIRANDGRSLKGSRHLPVELDLVEVKAHAFEELLAELPRPESVDFLQEVARELYHKEPSAEVLVHYFNKLKARPC